MPRSVVFSVHPAGGGGTADCQSSVEGHRVAEVPSGTECAMSFAVAGSSRRPIDLSPSVIGEVFMAAAPVVSVAVFVEEVSALPELDPQI